MTDLGGGVLFLQLEDILRFGMHLHEQLNKWACRVFLLLFFFAVGLLLVPANDSCGHAT